MMASSFLDIDECVEGSDGCTHNCTNTVGGYACTCNDGFELESNNHTCTGDDCMLIYVEIATYVSNIYVH